MVIFFQYKILTFKRLVLSREVGKPGMQTLPNLTPGSMHPEWLRDLTLERSPNS